MTRAQMPLLMGVGLLIGAIGLDVIGTQLQSLLVLIISLICGIAGALVAMRGVLDFLSSRV